MRDQKISIGPSFTKRGNLESCLKRKEMDKGQPHKGRTKVSLKIL
jgi:hypothetical protein